MRSLSGRLLVLTILFVLLGEVLIYVPSIARFRETYLLDRLDSGHLATRASEAALDGTVAEALEEGLLAHAMVEGVVLRRPEASMLMLSKRMPPMVDQTFDLRTATWVDLIVDAFEVLISGQHKTIRVLGEAEAEPGIVVEVVLRQAHLRAEMLDFSRRILLLSLVISLITAGLVYFSLQWMLVRPMRHITENLVNFRHNPEDARNVIEASKHNDEIGLAQQALATMQRDLRSSLLQKTRLAALGAAMSKINHDLRNTLASAMIVSDHLSQSEDPEVRRVTPRLMGAIDRAVNICSQTLDYAQSVEPKLEPSRFMLHDLVQDVREMVVVGGENEVTFRNDVATDLPVEADRVQLFRILMNLCGNAIQAMPSGGTLRISATPLGDMVAIDVADTGTGLPEVARENLFQPFAGSVRKGGTGLGLAIVRELIRSHGGDIALVDTSPAGTLFRLTLPAAAPVSRGAGAIESRPKATADAAN